MCVGLPAKVMTMKDGMAGDYVMVHAGIAIAKITEEDEDEAEDLLEGLL